MHERVEATLGKIIGWALLVTTLLVTPFWSLDPINPIKMLALTSFAFMGSGILLANWNVFGFKNYELPIILIMGFVGWQLIVLAISGSDTYQQIFGTTGRNTGFITYLAFSILFLVSVVASSSKFIRHFFIVVLATGVASISYGVIQALGVDPFDWVNPYSPVFGFLGNPNFQSSLLGFFGSIVFAQLFSSGLRIQIRVGYIAYLLLTLYVIKETASQQGYLVLLVGSAVALGIFVYQKSRTLGFAYIVAALTGFLGVLMGTLNKGPLASLLYKDSVTYRGDYWRAGWKMTLENPVFGVGLDSYGDWYRRSRTLEATLRRGPDVTSNAAHNVYLDISSYGGFPLLFIYIGLMSLVIVSAFRVLKRSTGFNAGFVGLLAGWVAFQAQSIISINQIGLAIWGWVLSGLIIGYEINTRNGEVTEKKISGKKSSKPIQASAGTTVAMFIGLVVGVLVGMPPYLASAKYKGALETSNPQIIQQAAYIWPVDPTRMIQVATTLDQNKLGAQALQVALDATKRFQDNYGVWATLYAMTGASDAQKAEALAQMKRLDPLNPNLK